MKLKVTLHSLALLALVGATTGCSLTPGSSSFATLNPNSSSQGTVGSYQPADNSGATPQVDYNQLKAPDRPPPLGTTNFIPVAPESFNSTGTLASKKVQQLREDLVLLQNSIAEQNQYLQNVRNTVQGNTQLYHSLVASISTRLQIGTTPGNPELVNQWNQAQGQLERLSSNVAELNNLSNSVAASATLSGYLLDSVKAAYGLSGAVDEDHRQLGILENDTNRTVVLIDRLLGELSKDISRQSNYLNNEQANLRTLSLAIKTGELYGRSLSSYAPAPHSFAAAPVVAAPRMPVTTAGNYAPRPSVVGGDPLVVIRFDDVNVNYERPLYNAVSQALQRKSNASFHLVAVTPRAGSAATFSRGTFQSEKNVEDVLRTLQDMGVEQGRVQVSSLEAADIGGNEVRLYVR